MKWIFKLWSEIKPQAKSNIDPKLGLRNWNKLHNEEKMRIWLYFNQRNYFIFNKTEKDRYKNDVYINKNDLMAIIDSIYHLNQNYKKQDLAKNFLKNNQMGFCYEDFKNNFFNQNEDIIMEMLSAYAKYLFKIRESEKLQERENETQEEYEKRLLKWRLEPLEKFKNVFNDIFEQFELNYRLTKGGIISYQSKKVIEEIYDPVLEFLCDSKFSAVNRDFEDAIKHFRHKTKEGYSTCISLCVTTIEAFLQILIYGTIGKKQTLSPLIKEAQNKGLIPKDFFTEKIFENLTSIFARIRTEQGQAHPKKEYATEKNAKLMLNLTMVFLQHCIDGD